MEGKKDLEDTLEFVKFSSLTWTGDSKGLFYNRYLQNLENNDKAGTETTSNTHQKISFHRIGESQEKD